MSGDNGGDEDSRERMQAMLRGFYDIQDEAGGANDAMDIDAAGFEADRYVESLLKTRSMEELLRQDDRMVKEIRELYAEAMGDQDPFADLHLKYYDL